MLSTCYKFLLFLLKPFLILYANTWFVLWSTDKNYIKGPNVQLVGQKQNAICKPFSVPKLKELAKTYGATLNDVVLSLVSMTVREYLRNHEDMDAKSINMLIPFSLREVPAKKEQHVLENDFTILCFTLKLFTTFQDAISSIQKQTSALKTSFYPHSVKALAEMIAWLPGTVGQLIMMWVVSKATMVLSNVPGPLVPLKYPGAESVGFIACIPGLGDLAIGISAMSMADRLYIAV